MNPKYIKTEDRSIIVFSPAIQHSDLRHLNPVSAGFISFGVNKDGNPSCTCYGESFSLGMKSEEEDTMLAKLQLNMMDIY
jgi:hypothetical protein